MDEEEQITRSAVSLLELQAPGVIEHFGAQARSCWLGYRLGPSIWPGYLRIGFASDLDFNAATLDVHHSNFDRLREGIDRFAKGRPAGVQFNTPGEFMTPERRVVIGSILLQPGCPLGRLDLLNLDYEPAGTVCAYQPDLLSGLLTLVPVLDAVPQGPARRALRRLDVALAELMPDDWTLSAGSKPDYRSRQTLASIGTAQQTSDEPILRQL